jgi:hypothetical protein
MDKVWCSLFIQRYSLFSSLPWLSFIWMCAEILFLHDYPPQSIMLNNDGWLHTSAGDLLLWVPPHCWSGLYHPGQCLIIGKLQTTKVDLTHAIAHGCGWLKWVPKFFTFFCSAKLLKDAGTTLLVIVKDINFGLLLLELYQWFMMILFHSFLCLGPKQFSNSVMSFQPTFICSMTSVLLDIWAWIFLVPFCSFI